MIDRKASILPSEEIVPALVSDSEIGVDLVMHARLG
jgi:hypothetical protein